MRKIKLALNKVEKMREHFKGTKYEAEINKLADKYIDVLNNPKGAYTWMIDEINKNISSLGIK